MKIVHLLFSLNVGGVEGMLVDILEHQSRISDTHLVIINNEINEVLLGTLNSRTTFYCIERTPGSRNLLPIIRLYKLLCRIKPDVIHMHDEIAINLPIYIPPKRAKKYLTVHDVHPYLPCKALVKYEKLFTISKAVHDHVMRKCGLASTIVPNGVNIKSVKRRKSKWCRKRHVKIIQISRLLHQKKGQHLLIEAVAALRKRIDSYLTITFIGEGKSKPFLETLAKDLNVMDRCFFAGLWSRSRIYKELCEFDLLVQPSLYEGFGLTVIEGMAAGIPVIASDEGGPAEIIDHGRYGWLFNNGDSEALSNCIYELLNIVDNETINDKLKSAYEYVQMYYDVKQTASHYLEEY